MCIRDRYYYSKEADCSSHIHSDWVAWGNICHKDQLYIQIWDADNVPFSNLIHLCPCIPDYWIHLQYIAYWCCFMQLWSIIEEVKLGVSEIGRKSPYRKTIRISLAAGALKNTNYLRNETILNVCHHVKVIAIQKVSLDQKSNLPKTCGRRIYKRITVAQCKKKPL